ncbi:MHYT domain-containing protein [Rheinheimera salexigens]|uniref:MHYT domain-containing protein n=1 Tax=Rheinheimera salexigens TaxID=1628148 RepID=UPI000AF946A9|nr:MHYT domain-containing protein [Rheinheimera salexigens]
MSALLQLFSYPADSLLLSGDYNYVLVALSIFIAVSASTLALALADEARHLAGTQRRIVLFTGSIALGTGIWAMHFIGMLAFMLCTPVSYLTNTTLLSMLPSLFASWVALTLISRHKITALPLLLGGVLMGAGIGAMHYSGMAAMTMSAQLRYSPSIFALSIVVAVALSILALYVRFGVAKLQFKLAAWHLNILAGVVMGLAITAMHYTGMAAARFVAPTDFVSQTDVQSQSVVLALSVAFVTILIGGLVLVLNLLIKFQKLSKIKQASAARLEAIMQTSLDAIISIDTDGNILNTNKASEAIFGWHLTDFIKLNIGELFPEPYLSEYKQYLTMFQQTNQPKLSGVAKEIQLKHKQGHLIPVRLSIGHINLPDTNIMVVYISDISKRVEMERVLRDREQQLSSLLSNIPGTAYRCQLDAHWSMLFISQAVKELTGYPVTDFLLPNPIRHFSDLIHPDDQEQFKQFKQLEHSQSFEFEYRILHSDGSERWVFDHGYCVRDESGAILWLDGFMMDISGRKALEQGLISARQQAEQAAAARASFMANMSHEIRTPMNAILGFTDILLETKLDSEQQKYLSTVSGASRSLLHLLNDVLDSAKLEKGKLDLELMAFSLRELLDSVISTLWLQARQKSLQLNLHVSADISEYVYGARDRLRQILLNIIGNAIKFTEQGSVTVNVFKQADMIQFEVLDTGIGIPAERLKQIFEPFTQADASMSRRFGGTGLGTTISKQLVELMGGDINATSTAGQGSCFSFNLPLKTAAKSDITVIANVKLNPLHILIADDIAQNIELLTILLQRAGHTVDAVVNGEQILQQLQLHNYDLVILDSQMPVMDGITAAKQRRAYEKQRSLPAVPMIVLTASVLPEDKLAARNAGIEGFASKPVNIDGLQLEIARVLKLDVKATQAKTAAISQNSNNINVTKGIAMWGSVGAYLAEVGRFLQQYQPWPAQLSEALQHQNFDVIKHSCHAVKGLSGNLALSQIYRLSSQLEQQIQQANIIECQASIDAITALFGLIQQEYLLLTEQVNTTQQQQISTEPPQNVSLIISNLLHAAKQNQLDDVAINQLQQCKFLHSNSTVVQLIAAFNDFEFSLATELLISLQQQCAAEEIDNATSV